MRRLTIVILIAAGVVAGYIAGHVANRSAYLYTRTLADRYAEQRDSALVRLERVSSTKPSPLCAARMACSSGY